MSLAGQEKKGPSCHLSLKSFSGFSCPFLHQVNKKTTHFCVNLNKEIFEQKRPLDFGLLYTHYSDGSPSFFVSGAVAKGACTPAAIQPQAPAVL